MKRKIMITALMSLLIFGTVACGKNEKTPQNSGVSQNQSTNSQSLNSNKTNEMYTFLDSVDLSGKTVIPFGTHGGSGFAGTVESIRELEPNARISSNGKTISRNSIGNAEKEIIDWVDEMGYRKE